MQELAILAHAEQVMGTVASFLVHPSPIGDRLARSAIGEACDVLHCADDVFSTWKPQSPLSRFRRQEVGLDQLPDQVIEVLRLCETAKSLCGGWFDPWAMPGGVDPTGLVKGWAVDEASAALRRRGVSAAMVNAGGDIAVFGQPGPEEGWRIGIRHPWRVDALACVLRVSAAVATSGGYERGDHLIDPFSGTPATAAASATVTGPSLALADAFATALVVGGDEALDFVSRLEGYDAYLIFPDGKEISTPGIVFADPIVPPGVAHRNQHCDSVSVGASSEDVELPEDDEPEEADERVHLTGGAGRGCLGRPDTPTGAAPPSASPLG